EADTDGKKITAQLQSVPTRLLVRIDDAEAKYVRVFNNGVDIGIGPQIDTHVDPGKQKITSQLAGHICLAVPEEFSLTRGESKDVIVRCREAGAVPVQPHQAYANQPLGPGPGFVHHSSNPSAPVAPKPKEGC